MIPNLSPSERLFFCFGPPKSGTTLLQRALDLHPEVSCPAEHNFALLHKGMTALFGDYNKNLQTVDRRTGGQGARLVEADAINAVFRDAVETIVRQAACGKPFMGANDNGIMYRLAFYDELFERPGLIAIFRNPIDQGLSAWHHNLRLAREENDPRHEQLVTRFGGLEGFLRTIVEQFGRDVAGWRAFSEGREHVYMVRYEDLVGERKATLRGIFTFLGADAADTILDPIITATDIDRMRAVSTNPEFFRRGGSDMGAEEVTPALRCELGALAPEALSWLGYRYE